MELLLHHVTRKTKCNKKKHHLCSLVILLYDYTPIIGESITTPSMMRVLLLIAWLVPTAAFVPKHQQESFPSTTHSMSRDDDSRPPNPLQGIADMFSNMDDVIDDFFYKRMGNGEVFYGKRKYNPSGKVEGEYSGFGLTDKGRIDVTRARKEAFLEEKRRREEEEAGK
jgi:hypothetical protein